MSDNQLWETEFYFRKSCCLWHVLHFTAVSLPLVLLSVKIKGDTINFSCNPKRKVSYLFHPWLLAHIVAVVHVKQILKGGQKWPKEQWSIFWWCLIGCLFNPGTLWRFALSECFLVFLWITTTRGHMAFPGVRSKNQFDAADEFWKYFSLMANYVHLLLTFVSFFRGHSKSQTRDNLMKILVGRRIGPRNRHFEGDLDTGWMCFWRFWDILPFLFILYVSRFSQLKVLLIHQDATKTWCSVVVSVYIHCSHPVNNNNVRNKICRVTWHPADSWGLLLSLIDRFSSVDHLT